MVRAVLLRNYGFDGVARINSNLEKYILTNKLSGIIFITAKFEENIILLKYFSVRYFRRGS
jgi:hypothetical protein